MAGIALATAPCTRRQRILGRCSWTDLVTSSAHVHWLPGFSGSGMRQGQHVLHEPVLPIHRLQHPVDVLPAGGVVLGQIRLEQLHQTAHRWPSGSGSREATRAAMPPRRRGLVARAGSLRGCAASQSVAEEEDHARWSPSATRDAAPSPRARSSRPEAGATRTSPTCSERSSRRRVVRRCRAAARCSLPTGKRPREDSEGRYGTARARHSGTYLRWC